MCFGSLTELKFSTKECEMTKVAIVRRRVLGLNIVATESRMHYFRTDFLHLCGSCCCYKSTFILGDTVLSDL